MASGKRNQTLQYSGVALYSGGTDSTLAPLLVRGRVDGDILLLMIDLGESSSSVHQAKQRAKVLGMDLKIVNGVKDFSKKYLSEAIQMRADYWGYPLGTPLGRAFQCSIAHKIIQEVCDTSKPNVLVHGCSARQNTRFRIERSSALTENNQVIGPLAERVYTRDEKVALLKSHGVKIASGDNVAQDANIFCRALEGDQLNTLEDIEKLGLYELVRPITKTPDRPVEFTLTFNSGIPIELNKKKRSLDEIIMFCRSEGAKHGIGRICAFEDTLPELGYKERSLYESPASRVIFPALDYISGSVLNLSERKMLKQIRDQWAESVYRGFWFSNHRSDLAKSVEILTNKLSGTVKLSLYKGNIVIKEAKIPGNLVPKPGALPGSY